MYSVVCSVQGKQHELPQTTCHDISPCCESAAASAVGGGHVKARERTQSACPVRLQACTNLPPGGARANLIVQSTAPIANSSLQTSSPSYMDRLIFSALTRSPRAACCTSMQQLCMWSCALSTARLVLDEVVKATGMPTVIFTSACGDVHQLTAVTAYAYLLPTQHERCLMF